MTPDPEDDGVPPLSKQSKKIFAEGGIVEFKGPFPDAWRGVEIPTWKAKELGLIPDCEDDQCTIGVNYHPDFQGQAATTRKEPCFEVTLSATTPDGTEYQQDTDIGWTPPPNTAVMVAKLKEDGELR